MQSEGLQRINRTLYQDKKSQGQRQQQQGIETTRCVDDSGLFLVDATCKSLQQQVEYHTGTVRSKIAHLYLYLSTRVLWCQFGPTGACRGLLGHFLWLKVCST